MFELALSRAADMLAADLDGVATDVLGRVLAALPMFAEAQAPPELTAALRASAIPTLAFALDQIRSDDPPGGLPEAAIEEARVAARAGLELDDITRGYRIAHAALYERLIDALEDLGLDRDTRREALRVGSRRMFAGTDAAIARVTEAHLAERDALLRSSERRRLALVQALLDGEPVDAGALGWPLEATQLALVASGPEADAAVGAITRALGLPALAVVPGAGSVWAWLSGEPAQLERAPRLMHAAAPPAGEIVGVGDPLPGRDGFARSHRRARAAHAVGQRADAGIVVYADVALEALALAHEAAARDFCARELGPLAQDDGRARVLRATLAAWFAAGQNAASAAAALGVHERTVAYRLRTVEERIGRPPALRRAELETAIRVRAALGTSQG